MAAREAHIKIRDGVPTERVVGAVERLAAALASLVFPPFALTLVFIVLACFASFGHANDVETPKPEFKTREEFAKYREAAWAHFRRRCENDAGETINRVVDNVEAIFLIKPRREASEFELGDQFWMGDPYGYSSYEASNPVGIYLHDRGSKTISRRLVTPIKGYRYVEMHNPKYREEPTHPRYLRFSLGSVAVVNSVTKKAESRIRPRATGVDQLLSRYGITWDDISTREDREFWIAGGKLTILDLSTNEVLGERVGYVIDPQFGDNHQGRKSWLAVGFVPDAFCPKFENRFDRNKEFVAKVLRASAGRKDGR